MSKPEINEVLKIKIGSFEKNIKVTCSSFQYIRHNDNYVIYLEPTEPDADLEFKWKCATDDNGKLLYDSTDNRNNAFPHGHPVKCILSTHSKLKKYKPERNFSHGVQYIKESGIKYLSFGSLPQFRCCANHDDNYPFISDAVFVGAFMSYVSFIYDHTRETLRFSGIHLNIDKKSWWNLSRF
jgi:hypothetical protein